MAALVITLKAAYDIGPIEELENIGVCVKDALEALRGEGVARVECVVLDDATADVFMHERSGITDFEFDMPTPVRARIEFD